MKNIKLFTFVGLASCVMLAGCGPKPVDPGEDEPPTPSHTHTFDVDHWEKDDNSHWHKATCEHTDEKSGLENHIFGGDNICDVCGFEKEVSHIHTFDEEHWMSDATNHWHAATCEHTEEKSGVAAHTFGEDGKCTVCEFYDEEHDAALKVFTKEKLGYLAGKFYAFNYVLEVGVEGATISYGEEKVALTNHLIKGSGFETKVSYKDPSGGAYYLSWEKSYYSRSYDQNEKKMVDLGLMVPTIKVGKQSIQFQPDMTSLSGWYDGAFEFPLWDSSEYSWDESILCYVLGNEFDPEVNMFNSNVVSFSYEDSVEGQHIYSAFKEVEGEVYQTVSFFDSSDLAAGYNYTDFSYIAEKDAEDGKIYLLYATDPEYAGFWTRPSMLMGEYLKPEDVGMSLADFEYYYDYLFFSELDEELGTVCVEWDSVEVEEGFDEKGAFVTVGDMKIRGTNWGITVEKEGKVEEYPFYFYNVLSDIEYTVFSSGENTIECNYDWDTWELCLYVDGVIASDCTVEVYNHQIAFCGKVDSDTYYMMPFDGTTAVKVVKNGESSYYFNAWELSFRFVGDYYTSDMTLFAISDDGEMKVTIGEGEAQTGLFTYSEEYDAAVLEFGEGDIIIRLNSDKKLFAWLTADGKGGSILYEQSLVDSIYGKWGSGTQNLYVEEDKVIIGSNNYTIKGLDVLQDGFGDLIPAIFFESNLAKYAIIPEGQYLQVLKGDLTGSFAFYGSFIQLGIIDQMEGEFIAYTELGNETIVFKDGEFQIDAQGEEPGTLERLTLDYYLFQEEDIAVIQFEYGEVSVNVEYDSEFNHVTVGIGEFALTYLRKEFFDVQGLYGTSKDSYFSVVDSTIVCNGEEMIVDSVNGSIISGFIGTDYVSATFSEGSVSVVVGEAEPVVLSKNEVQLSDFIVDVQENVGDLSRDIKVTEYGIFIAFTGTDSFEKVTDFEYVIDDSGNVSIVFENSLIYTFTISIEEGEVVISGESSLPPLPPPPPPLLF